MEIKQTIKEYLQQKISSEFSDDDDFFKLGLVDSLFALQLVLFLENEFHIKIENEDLDIDNFCSLNALIRFVLGKSPP